MTLHSLILTHLSGVGKIVGTISNLNVGCAMDVAKLSKNDHHTKLRKRKFEVLHIDAPQLIIK